MTGKRLGRSRLLLDGRLSSLDDQEAVLVVDENGSLVVLTGGVLVEVAVDELSNSSPEVTGESELGETSSSWTSALLLEDSVASVVEETGTGSSEDGDAVKSRTGATVVEDDMVNSAVSGALVELLKVSFIPRAAARSCCSDEASATSLLGLELGLEIGGTSCTIDSPVTSGELFTVLMMGFTSPLSDWLEAGRTGLLGAASVVEVAPPLTR